ncbi:MFS multidrug transporter [Diaporthe amygdali]|uniref:MFS multidrug transporter n=1 Tax=Phomopsis amygdali TaxID=1214568 RepID=UPI0022FEAB08|nr:MFS multidrug transporter [Diaporthe amygdali]KAJ0108722.1 MFS multidrug transporter [Diaporthe amygdali]
MSGTSRNRRLSRCVDVRSPQSARQAIEVGQNPSIHPQKQAPSTQYDFYPELESHKATEETSSYIPASESLHSLHQTPSKLGEDHDGATAEWLQMQTVVHKESEQTLFRREIEDSEGHLDLEAGQRTENVQAHPDEDNVVANVEENKYLQGYELVTVVICVIIVYFLTYLNGAGMIATAVPAITAEFNSLADIGWYGSAYFMATAVMLPLTGKIFTNFSTKWFYIAFVVTFCIGSAISGAANSSAMLIGGRVITGLGASGIYNGSQTLMVAGIPTNKRPLIFSLVVAVFYLNLPFGGLAVLILIFSRIPDQCVKPPFFTALTRLPQYLDLIGWALLGTAVFVITFALERGAILGWSSAAVIGLFSGGGVALVLFLIWDWYKEDDGLIPFSVVKLKIVWSAAATAGALGSILNIQGYFLPLYFQAVLGQSASMSGLSLLPSLVPQIAIGVLAGILMGKLGYYLPQAIFGAILITVGSGLLTLLGVGTSTAEWAAYQVIIGIGRGFTTQVANVALQMACPKEKVSVAIALQSFSQSLGGAVFLQVATVLFQTGLKSGLTGIAGLDVSMIYTLL